MGYVRLSADKYVIARDHDEQMSIKVYANKKVAIKSKNIIVQAVQKTLGEHTEKVYYDYGNKYTILNYLVVSSPEELINKRVNFIVEHQQMNNPEDPRSGAYMVYDNEGDSIFTSYGGDNNRNVAQERIGMGVLVGQWLQNHKDPKVYKSFLRYVSFVRNKLQSPDYHVYDNIRKQGNRGYNHPWVADLYLQAYRVTGDKHYVEDYYHTLRKFYKDKGHGFYAIDIRVRAGIEALKGAGRKAMADSLLHDFILMGNDFVKNGIYYPPHEVNYEETIVAPSVQFLSELYQLTRDKKYLNSAKEQMSSLIAFCGRQPDVHLNWIANRFRDGYWFGKSAMWGDTMPHYWSAVVGTAFNEYFQCTEDTVFTKRALRIVQNNLLNFKEDGRASCAYIYPDFVNGKPGKFYDVFANDQDWAFVFYMRVMQNKF